MKTAMNILPPFLLLALLLVPAPSRAEENRIRDLTVSMEVSQQPVKLLMEFPHSGLGVTHYFRVLVDVHVHIDFANTGSGVSITEPFKVQVVAEGVHPSVPAEFWVDPNQPPYWDFSKQVPVYFPIRAAGQTTTMRAVVDGCWSEEVFTDYCRAPEYDEDNNWSLPVQVILQ